MPRDASPQPCPPLGVDWREGVLENAVPIRWAIAAPKGVIDGPPILLLQGRTEAVEKYAETIALLTAAGRRVLTFDWRGQGRSGREAAIGVGHVKRFEDYLSDLNALLAGPFADHAGPFDVIGHSMGGHLAIRFALSNRQAVRTLTLSAPMIDLPYAGIVRRVGLLGIGATCRLGGGRKSPSRHDLFADDAGAAAWFPTNPLTGDRPRYDAWAGFCVDHPKLALNAGSFGWLRAAFRSIDETWPRHQDLSVPSLWIWGDGERVVDADAVATAASRANGARTLILSGARHEPMIEQDAPREAFWAAWRNFMDACA